MYNPRFNCNFPPLIDQSIKIIKDQEEHHFSLFEFIRSRNPLSTFESRSDNLTKPFAGAIRDERARFPRCEICVAALPVPRWSSMSQKFDVSAIMNARARRWRAIVNPRNERARSPFNKYNFDYAICLVNCKPAEFGATCSVAIYFGRLRIFVNWLRMELWSLNIATRRVRI